MKRLIHRLPVLVLCLFLGVGMGGCSRTGRSFVTGLAVGVAAATAWCTHCCKYVRHCGHSRH